MFGSLHTGLSGLRTNLRYLEVVGNNLANSATTGFKSDRASFRDVFYNTFRHASGPSGSLGGVNARQVGTGASIGSIDTIQTQGAIVQTGRTFDLAIEGGGFFVVNDGNQDYYTRVGTFGIDAQNNLVDTRTGMKVQGLSGSDIDLSTSLSVPANPTSSLSFGGNLPAEIGGPLAEEQSTISPFEDHRAAQVTSTLPAATTGLDISNQTLTVTIDSRSPVTVTMPATATNESLATAAAAIDAAFTAAGIPATAYVDAAGALIVESDTKGDNSLVQLSGALTTTLGLPTTQALGTESTAIAATEINFLSANTRDYVAGDVIRITGINDQGQAVNILFNYGTDGTTLGDLVTKINASGAYTNATATLESTGNIKMVSSVKGENNMTIAFSDATGGVGRSNWSSHAFRTDVEGTDADEALTSRTVYDSLGIAHEVSGRFERQDDGTWNLELTMPAADGSVAGGTISGLTFGPDGSLQGPVTASVDLTFSDGAAPSTLTLDLGGQNGLGGITQHDGGTTVKITDQDGYASGDLASFVVSQTGEIVGKYSNGVDLTIDSIAIATFRNPEGLEKAGSTLFAESSNSGVAQLDHGGAGGAGLIQSGSLEGSNVDTAEEFVRLIEAQRSFQGNARVITKSDEMLAELVQIV